MNGDSLSREIDDTWSNELWIEENKSTSDNNQPSGITYN